MEQIITQIVFYVFSAILIASSAMVVFSRSAVKSALFLVLAFVASAGLWILLEAEFLALILVIVYVGAVMTLFLFVVMMLNLEKDQLKTTLFSWKQVPFFLLVILMILAMLFMVVGPHHFGLEKYAAPTLHPADYSNLKALGSVLYTDYLLQFEIAALILFVAIVAAIVLTHRDPRERKKQDPAMQVRVKAKDRIRIVKMPTSKKSGEV
jgi:NADH-quinone oxidoreductase subunit J